uniref:(northern house mosquito) hypothetical protein n=1 Tax=Culex pipiens TaxID=7175 RepID=A0A8D8BKJ0_CULPI
MRILARVSSRSGSGNRVEARAKILSGFRVPSFDALIGHSFGLRDTTIISRLQFGEEHLFTIWNVCCMCIQEHHPGRDILRFSCRVRRIKQVVHLRKLAVQFL